MAILDFAGSAVLQAVWCCRQCGVAGGEQVPHLPLGWYLFLFLLLKMFLPSFLQVLLLLLLLLLLVMLLSLLLLLLLLLFYILKIAVPFYPAL